MSPQTSRTEQAEKRRQHAAEYRQRPERREKQRLLMAERRAAVKAARRRWDPPKVPKTKKPKAPPPLPTAPSTSSNHETQLPNCGDEAETIASITPAERFALGVLAELERGEEPVAPGLLDTTACIDIDTDGTTDDDMQMRHPSPSQASSVAAVLKEPVQPPNEQPDWITRRHRPLPAYVTPETPLQKKMRRELGTVGPLTPIQVVQIKAFKLRRPSKYHEDEEEENAVAPAPDLGPLSYLSTARRQSIREWRRQLKTFDMVWDAPVRREFAEEALRRRKLLEVDRSSSR
ncbi:hypothetical protein B0H14DRAFT_3498761 [Mycena olivaceomarginata]|nr:hypothetical protein B0H14DRAFT_3498761 [Mycena olivaceomarginata]